MPARPIPRSPLPRAGDQEPTSTAIALHPYAVDTETLEELVEELHEVDASKTTTACRPLHHRDGLGLPERLPTGRLRAGDPGPGRASCAAPTATCSRTAAASTSSSVYWFSWKDIPDACNFCDSVGLFRAGASASSRSPPGTPSSPSPAGAYGLEVARPLPARRAHRKAETLLSRRVDVVVDVGCADGAMFERWADTIDYGLRRRSHSRGGAWRGPAASLPGPLSRCPAGGPLRRDHDARRARAHPRRPAELRRRLPPDP